ncbi:NAD-dependent epimerase/dehydratase family protein [Halieaceae bacterium IMCC14734]|uniref:NAD-dependent epimerase/dehydratase family protein n=1 Tax=Candidatus Litorirhabdus singularis TaxID=2518993 RepID=A0ABT3TI27_9GAMM|nr:NAD(P)H-binding protein [Candidatus Litorirhabdus singularis]MCX2981948.1 NAD-dependent epimerase/dehydratase family protein [Candidatus Litorirhabdus singularis]
MSLPHCIAITGANGHLGLKLLNALSDQPVKALVRSASAASTVTAYVADNQLQNVTIEVVDYQDTRQMQNALEGTDYLVHLVGIIKESASNTFDDAHIHANQVLCHAVAGSSIRHLCHLSLLGADENSRNTCLQSRGTAERLLLNSGVATLILRIPMVLGGDDYASYALRKRAHASLSFSFRAASLEQPIAARDVLAAVLNDIARAQQGASVGNQLLELAGPQSLPRAELFERAAATQGNSTRVISLPLWCGMGLAWLLEKLSSTPPVTRAMLGVLDHDDNIEAQVTATTLGVTLTSLDATLKECLAESQ